MESLAVDESLHAGSETHRGDAALFKPDDTRPATPLGESREHGVRARPVQREPVCLVRDVTHRALLHHDVTAQRFDRALQRVRVAFQQHAAGKHEYPQIGVDTPFAVQPERATDGELRHTLQFLRQHPVQELEAIRASDFNDAALRPVHERAPLSDCSVFKFEGAEGADDLNGAGLIAGAVTLDVGLGAAVEVHDGAGVHGEG